MTKAAIVLGASGSVGNALIDELLRDGGFSIVTLVRRARAEPDERIREVVVGDMTPAALEAATARAASGDVALSAVGFSVLGIGAGTGKITIAEHRAVDVELNAAFARGLKASGRATHLAFMSAAGANPTARETGSGAAGMARYARVKGESEEAVKASGLIVGVFRPGMIIGSQHTPWLLEKILPVFGFVTPKNYRSISVGQIARAMIAMAHDPPSESRVYHYPEMAALARTISSSAAASTAPKP